MFHLNKLYSIIYTFTATSLFIFVYLVKEHIGFDLPIFSDKQDFIVSIIIYFLVILLFAKVCILLQHFNSGKDKLEGIKEIEYADNSFLPTYLGFFFVALGMPSLCEKNSLPTIIIVYALIFVFTIYSRSAYYNPIFLMFGFKFYYVKNTEEVKLLLITKKNLKRLSDWNNKDVYRINNYTFIDLNKN